jgi:hypothetical protein
LRSALRHFLSISHRSSTPLACPGARLPPREGHPSPRHQELQSLADRSPGGDLTLPLTQSLAHYGILFQLKLADFGLAREVFPVPKVLAVCGLYGPPLSTAADITRPELTNNVLLPLSSEALSLSLCSPLSGHHHLVPTSRAVTRRKEVCPRSSTALTSADMTVRWTSGALAVSSVRCSLADRCSQVHPLSPPLRSPPADASQGRQSWPKWSSSFARSEPPQKRLGRA